ncbi:MAG: phosphatase PAP2 family protein [Flavobacteriales bacterium]|nr:phosphatase PAP2 family protein [Flavobacteriales bacterium]MCB9167963.1 phosphatase PAP2 family protein [Flavobacteriales bacterium]
MHRRRNVLLFLLTAATLAIPPLLGLLRLGKLGLHQAVNAEHPSWLDPVMHVSTNVADGLVPTVVAILLLLAGRWRQVLMVGVSAAGSGLLVQLLKRNVFAGSDRPAEFLDRMPEVRLVEGVVLDHHFSFPSGHAATAFSLCLAMAVIDGRRWTGPFWSMLAAGIAFTRVYLSEHFTGDILAGGTIGVVVTTGVFLWLYSPRSSDRAWLDRRPLGLFRG